MFRDKSASPLIWHRQLSRREAFHPIPYPDFQGERQCTKDSISLFLGSLRLFSFPCPVPLKCSQYLLHLKLVLYLQLCFSMLIFSDPGKRLRRMPACHRKALLYLMPCTCRKSTPLKLSTGRQMYPLEYIRRFCLS